MNNVSLIDELMNKPLPKLSEEEISLIRSNAINKISTTDIDELLVNEEWQNEYGYTELGTGRWLVATNTYMPGVTKEMINWWFWWHAKDSRFYQVWYPGEHFATSVKEKASYEGAYPGYLPLPTTQYPKESIGKLKGKLAINFVEPREFGIDSEVLEKSKIGTLLCANVGVMKGLIYHTKMLHLFREEENGVTIISRFWMGDTLPPFVGKHVVNKSSAEDMTIHCKIDYTRLGQILPQLYEAFK